MVFSCLGLAARADASLCTEVLILNYLHGQKLNNKILLQTNKIGIFLLRLQEEICSKGRENEMINCISGEYFREEQKSSLWFS